MNADATFDTVAVSTSVRRVRLDLVEHQPVELQQVVGITPIGTPHIDQSHAKHPTTEGDPVRESREVDRRDPGGTARRDMVDGARLPSTDDAAQTTRAKAPDSGDPQGRATGIELSEVQKTLGRSAQALVGRSRLVNHQNRVWTAVEALDQRGQGLREQASGDMHDAGRVVDDRRDKSQRGSELERAVLVHELQLSSIERRASRDTLVHP